MTHSERRRGSWDEPAQTPGCTTEVEILGFGGLGFRARGLGLRFEDCAFVSQGLQIIALRVRFRLKVDMATLIRAAALRSILKHGIFPTPLLRTLNSLDFVIYGSADDTRSTSIYIYMCICLCRRRQPPNAHDTTWTHCM